MTKKIIAVLVMVLFVVNPFCAHASSVDDLDNRYETESTAGITWDQINEMAQNSPNSLTPIQGLVLWMFAIIAFLKLAQKMDDLLQKLGLNVTQTGGRALGDLMVAGLALKNIGNVISKGVGAFGLGNSAGGGSSSSGSSGTTGGSSSSATSGGGPTPIPAGGPSGGVSSANSNPGTVPHGGQTATMGTPAHAPPVDSPAATSRNPIGRAVAWMRGDSFARGAVRAGMKGGIIGLGAYGAKTGIAKAGAAISAHSGADELSLSTQDDGQNSSARTMTDGQPVSDTIVNPEEFQSSMPLHSTEDNTTVPTNINSEDYHYAEPFNDDDALNHYYSSSNSEGFAESGSYDTITDSQPVHTSIGVGQNVDADTSEALPVSADINSEAWQDTAPQDSAGDVSISSASKESWNDSVVSEQPSYNVAAEEFIPSEVAQGVPTVQNNDASLHTTGSHVAQNIDPASADIQSGYPARVPESPSTQLYNEAIHGERSQDAPRIIATSGTPTNNTAATNVVPPMETFVAHTQPSNSTGQQMFSQETVETHTPIQSTGNAIRSNTPAYQMSSEQSVPAHAQSATEIIHTDSPVVVQTHDSAAVPSSETVQLSSGAMMQSHTPQENNITKINAHSQPQTLAQPVSQVITQVNSSREPTANEKQENQSMKGSSTDTNNNQQKQKVRPS